MHVFSFLSLLLSLNAFRGRKNCSIVASRYFFGKYVKGMELSRRELYQHERGTTLFYLSHLSHCHLQLPTGLKEYYHSARFVWAYMTIHTENLKVVQLFSQTKGLPLRPGTNGEWLTWQGR
jgi:hypothetical protein